MLVHKKEEYLKCILFGILFIVLISLVNAQETTLTDPGVTPDSFLWGLDKAFDQITFLLASGDVDKVKKGLEIAEERLAEIREMIEENKLEEAGKAQDAHGKTLLKVKIEIEGEITEEQKDLITFILNSLEGQTGEVEIEIENKKNKIKIEIEQETGKSEEEVEREIESIEEEKGIKKQEKALEALKHIGKVRENKFFDNEGSATQIIREWRDKRK